MDEPLDMDEAMEEFEAMQDEDEWDAMHEDEWEALRDMDGPPAKRPTGTATASNASIEPSSQLTEAPDGSYSGGDKGGGIQATKSRVSDVLARVRATLGRTTGNASTSGSSGKSGPSSIAASSSNGQQPQQSQPEAESQSVPAVSSTDVFRNVFGIPAVKRAPLARTMQTRRSLAIRGEGKHVYLSTQDNKMKKATAGQSEGSSGVVASSAYPHQLLAVPMKSLRERVEQINMEKTLEANRRFQADIDRLDGIASLWPRCADHTHTHIVMCSRFHSRIAHSPGFLIISLLVLVPDEIFLCGWNVVTCYVCHCVTYFFEEIVSY
eukprot:m.226032 g.226032  ORF g.226032 m.226032 type:complete len:323 (-) comp15163_c0_seq1:60-1028(-)